MKAKGPIFLLATAVLWGMAFVAQTSAAESLGPFTFNASRNAIGILFLAGVIEWRKRTGQDRAPTGGRRPKEGSDGAQVQACANMEASGSVDAPANPQPRASEGMKASASRPESASPRNTGSNGSTTPAGYTRRTLWIAGIACGFVLFAGAYLQQAGITAYPSEAAASSRSGFVTATYMVMVAVMGIFIGKKPSLLVWLAAGVALAGMHLLCVPPSGLGSIYLGDWLVLASAFAYALHIIVIDRYTQVDGVRLSQIQLIVSGVLSLAGALVFEHPSPTAIASAVIPILYAGIASDGIAYTLQIIGQQTTDPTVASIIMSLEAVFAALGGWLVLSERLTPLELLGCALVLAGVILAQLPEFSGPASRPSASAATACA